MKNLIIKITFVIFFTIAITSCIKLMSSLSNSSVSESLKASKKNSTNIKGKIGVCISRPSIEIEQNILQHCKKEEIENNFINITKIIIDKIIDKVSIKKISYIELYKDNNIYPFSKPCQNVKLEESSFSSRTSYLCLVNEEYNTICEFREILITHDKISLFEEHKIPKEKLKNNSDYTLVIWPISLFVSGRADNTQNIFYSSSYYSTFVYALYANDSGEMIASGIRRQDMIVSDETFTLSEKKEKDKICLNELIEDVSEIITDELIDFIEDNNK